MLKSSSMPITNSIKFSIALNPLEKIKLILFYREIKTPELLLILNTYCKSEFSEIMIKYKRIN